ncbi:MAG: hypothetical protein M1818_004047 [Claussenomyces sp. TS43310]|nr:MAG: hypothetical protein M1818_004047 [Claussenomyces sp. TS43310]
MGETPISILCGEDYWLWSFQNYIRFNENGTGELVCASENWIGIGAEFDWKPQRSEKLDQFDIELTLTKRRSEMMRHPQLERRTINEALLTDDAFLPKTYTVELEKGNFREPLQSTFHPKEVDYETRYALRLTFNKSPYPPRHEWKQSEWGAQDQMRMWEWKDFCGRSSPELKQADWRSNCVVS